MQKIDRRTLTSLKTTHAFEWGILDCLYISLVINQWLSYCKYIYIYTSQTSQVKLSTGTFLVWLMQVRLKVKQAPIKHYIPSDKVLAWRYIDHKSLLIICLTQLYKFFTCFWGISTYKNCYKFVQHWILTDDETPP